MIDGDLFWYDSNVPDDGVTPPRPSRGESWNHAAPSFAIDLDRHYTWSNPGD